MTVIKETTKNNTDGLISWINIPFPVVLQRNIIFKNINKRSKWTPACLLSDKKLTINLINSSSLGWKTHLKSSWGKYLLMFVNHFLLNSIWTQISIKILRWTLFYDFHVSSVLSGYFNLIVISYTCILVAFDIILINSKTMSLFFAWVLISLLCFFFKDMQEDWTFFSHSDFYYQYYDSS